jgi:hypothetical protein
MKSEVVIVGEALPPLVEVSRLLNPSSYAISIIQAERPVDYLLQRRSHQPEGVIAWLAGNENVADFRAVCSANPKGTLIFLAASFPPRPAIARVVNEYHGAILRTTESPLTIVATLVALQSQRLVT